MVPVIEFDAYSIPNTCLKCFNELAGALPCIRFWRWRLLRVHVCRHRAVRVWWKRGLRLPRPQCSLRRQRRCHHPFGLRNKLHWLCYLGWGLRRPEQLRDLRYVGFRDRHIIRWTCGGGDGAIESMVTSPSLFLCSVILTDTPFSCNIEEFVEIRLWVRGLCRNLFFSPPLCCFFEFQTTS